MIGWKSWQSRAIQEPTCGVYSAGAHCYNPPPSLKSEFPCFTSLAITMKEALMVREDPY